MADESPPPLKKKEGKPEQVKFGPFFVRGFWEVSYCFLKTAPKNTKDSNPPYTGRIYCIFLSK